jgi:hypothetical protein
MKADRYASVLSESFSDEHFVRCVLAVLEEEHAVCHVEAGLSALGGTFASSSGCVPYDEPARRTTVGLHALRSEDGQKLV